MGKEALNHYLTDRFRKSIVIRQAKLLCVLMSLLGGLLAARRASSSRGGASAEAARASCTLLIGSGARYRRALRG